MTCIITCIPVDESFVDVTHSHELFGDNFQIAQKIQNKVFEETGIVTTIGIGPNPLMAKLALDNDAKKSTPWVASWNYNDVPKKLWKIDNLTDFWSIGSKTAIKLEHMGIHNLYDLAHTNRSKLKTKFGVLGDALYFHAWGIDYSDLAKRYTPSKENRGYDNSQVLMRDYITKEDIETILFETADQVGTRLRKHKVLGSVVGISIGFSEPDDSGKRGWRAQTQIDPTNQTNNLINAVKYLFEKKWQGNVVRNIGVSVSRITEENVTQISLFENPTKHDNDLVLEHTIDQIRKRYGYKSIVRGYSKKEAGTAIERNTNLIGGHQV